MAEATILANSPRNNARVLYSRKRLAHLPADVIAESIEELIAVLDERGGDLDLEECGLEDSFQDHAHWRDGPGCPVADIDFGIDDERHDDDDPKEDDDPAGGNVTDEPHDGCAEDGL